MGNIMIYSHNIYRKYTFLFIISLLFCVSLISISSTLNLDHQLYKNNNNIIKFLDELPKLSATSFNIATPENKTYKEPMSGYYPATYGFENEFDGTSGTDIGFIDTLDGGGSVEVISELNDHSKVIYYNTTGDWQWTRNSFELSQTSGTVEFWIRLGETNERHVTYLLDGSGGSISLSWWEDGYLKYDDRPDGIIETIESYNALQWYHVRIEFDLATDWHLWIDGVSKDGGSGYGYDHTPSSFDEFTFGGSDYSNMWLDGVSYSWDSAYAIGDNLYEGLLLSFENNTKLDWIGYSLDGQVNKTIFGNTTISFPTNDGLHSIQVFGNDSLGTMFHSGVRYFITQIIKIITPESKIYTEPMNGYYPATNGFEDEPDGTSGTDIGFVDSLDSGGSVEVISELDGHSKVIRYNTTGNWQWARNNFELSHTSGTVEFWIRLGEANERHVTYLLDGSGGSISLSWWENGSLVYDDRPDGIIEEIGTYNALQWYHVRIEFDLATDWHLWIDGVSKDGGSGYGYDHTPSSFDEFTFGGSDSSNMWLDGVSYSWDQTYSIGNNMNEGLLLSFDNNTQLNWIGYSLDGQINRTILGNTTIPFLNEGSHTIQVFGNNSQGTIFQSEVRHFLIDLTAPTSMISFTPHSGTNDVNKSTMFTIIADDGVGSGISLIRYKINDSIWTDYDSPFNLSNYDYGYYLIYYYAIDAVGHTEIENTLVVNLVEIESEPHDNGDPTISGYFFPLLLTAISLIIIIKITKKLKN